MQIAFQKAQITEKQNSIIIDYGEYKLSMPKCFVKNNTFNIYDNNNYWVFNHENSKQEINGKALKTLLKPYIVLEQIQEKQSVKQSVQKLTPCEFYEQYNGHYIFKSDKGEECFQYNVTWANDKKSFKINNPYKFNDNLSNYIVMPYQPVNTHNDKIFLFGKVTK